MFKTIGVLSTRKPLPRLVETFDLHTCPNRSISFCKPGETGTSGAVAGGEKGTSGVVVGGEMKTALAKKEPAG